MTRSNAPVRLEAHHSRQASAVMGRAFQDDPGWQYLIPDHFRRLRLLPPFFHILVRYSLRYGDVYTTQALEGVACWLPPGNTSPLFSRLARIGIRDARLGLELGWAGFRRYTVMQAYNDAVHKQCVPGQHWYLWAIGVDPPYQNQGIGAMLMQPVLARAEAHGLPCYLETSTERNVVFYKKYGFTVVSEGAVPKSSLRVWAMLRKPFRMPTSLPHSAPQT
jgi:ribosomal protein S18 acetylase RimI-like enzyme